MDGKLPVRWGNGFLIHRGEREHQFISHAACLDWRTHTLLSCPPRLEDPAAGQSDAAPLTKE